jgi:beta-N-acetylhexosaminidase
MAALAPPIVHDPIPFGSTRIAETRAYAVRHYGLHRGTAIGIEHVGFREAGVLGSIKMLRASLRLTRWLQAKYGIADNNVIGHAESLSSPYHHENLVRLKTQTHGDWPHRFMVTYRRDLAAE